MFPELSYDLRHVLGVAYKLPIHEAELDRRNRLFTNTHMTDLKVMAVEVHYFYAIVIFLERLPR
jgi:hypothetical protein